VLLVLQFQSKDVAYIAVVECLCFSYTPLLNVRYMLLGLCGRSAVSLVMESTLLRAQRGNIRYTSGRKVAEIWSSSC